VVELAEQDQILQVRRPAGRPGLDVVGFQMAGLVAAGVLAGAVSDHQGAALGAADEAAGAAEGEGFTVGDDRGEEWVVAGEALGGGGFEGSLAGEVADVRLGR